MVLFANYKTFSIAVDDKGKKHKAQGGKRIMHTTHHPCWDAKNRYGLPEEIPFDYAEIAHIFREANNKSTEKKQIETGIKSQCQEPVKNPEPVNQAEPEKTASSDNNITNETKDKGFKGAFDLDPAIPKALRDLMEKDLVTEEEIQEVVAARGYYPAATPITNYEPDFISGVLVGAWPQVFNMIKEMRDKYEIPFN